MSFNTIRFMSIMSFNTSLLSIRVNDQDRLRKWLEV
jgi:hypothetical protein